MRDGILSGPVDTERSGPVVYPPVEVRPGLVVRHRASGTTGAVIDWRPSRVTLLDRNGHRHQFVNERGVFAVNGAPVTLVAPKRGGGQPDGAPTRSGRLKPGIEISSGRVPTPGGCGRLSSRRTSDRKSPPAPVENSQE